VSRSEDFEGSYRMQHQAPGEDAAPLHDLTANGVFPKDIHTSPQFYFHDSENDPKGYQVAKRVQGKPEATVTAYRAVPKGVQHINPGDWVAVHPDYARQHAMLDDDPKHDMPVISAEVPAKHLTTDGNSLSEWGYNGPKVKGRQFK